MDDSEDEKKMEKAERQAEKKVANRKVAGGQSKGPPAA